MQKIVKGIEVASRRWKWWEVDCPFCGKRCYLNSDNSVGKIDEEYCEHYKTHPIGYDLFLFELKN